MLPVGRLTLLRYFSKVELAPALSFVAMPGLVGSMLGPVTGGLIVSALSWRFVFFVNIPIGLIGLYLIGRYLPNFREERRLLTLQAFCCSAAASALLSYVLEVFGDHTLDPGFRLPVC